MLRVSKLLSYELKILCKKYLDIEYNYICYEEEDEYFLKLWGSNIIAYERRMQALDKRGINSCS